MAGALTPKEISEAMELDKMEGLQGRHWNLMACSAQTGEGLLNGINWVVGDIQTRIFMME